jgi:hypothetical protein
MKGVGALVCIMMLLLCLFPLFQAPVLANNEDPNAQGKILGSWNITTMKSYKDRTIEVGGNLTIANGGTLKLDHVTLIMNSTPGHEYYITIEMGGTLQVINGSKITSNATYDRPYFINANYGSALLVQNSQLRRMGNTSATVSLATIGMMGLLLQNNAATIQDSVISDSYAGTVCTNLLAVKPAIIGVTYQNNSMGLGIGLGCNPTLNNNVFIKNGIGAAVMYKVQALTTFNNDKFYNNTLALGVTDSPVSIKSAHIENSTQMGLGAMDGSVVTVDGSVLKGNRNATYMDSSTLIMANSNVTASTQWDFFATNKSTATALNTSLDGKSKIKVNDTGSVFELQWNLNVRAQYQNGTPIFWAWVNVTDDKGILVWGDPTNETGWTGQFAVTEARDKGLGLVELTPHNLTAELGAYWNLTTVTVDHSQNVVLNLWERDLVDPQIAIESPLDGDFINTTSAQIAGTATDDKDLALIQVSNETGAWINATGTANWEGTVPLDGDGAHTICARATDTSGNTVTSCINVTLDTVTPTLTVTEPDEGTYFNHSQLFVKGTTDADMVIANGDSVAVFNGNFSYPFTLTKDGANDLVLIAKDKAGNQYTTSLRVFRDLVAPSIVVLRPLQGTIVTQNTFVVGGNITDAQGVVGMWASTDNITWKVVDLNFTGSTSGTGAFTVTFTLPEGEHTIYLKATDRANNGARTTFNVTIKLPDVTAPTLKVLSPKDGDTVQGLKTKVNGTAIDDEAVGSVELSMDGTNWTAAESYDNWAHWSLNLTLKEGANTIYARAFDLALNKAVAVVTVTAIKPFVDAEKPAITINSVKDGQTLSKKRIVLKGLVSDNVRVKSVFVSLNGSGPGAQWVAASLDSSNTSWTIEVTLKSGWNSVSVRASDTSGNTNTTTISVRYAKKQQSVGLNYGMVAIFIIIMLVLIVVYILTLPGREKAKKAKGRPVSKKVDEEISDEEE